MSSFTARVRFFFRLFQAYLLAVLRTQILRRKLMMMVTLAALVMLFFGYAIIDGFLSRHPFVFAAYWVFCMLLVVLMLLLGIYDIIRLSRGQPGLLEDLKSIIPDEKLREISDLLEKRQAEQEHGPPGEKGGGDAFEGGTRSRQAGGTARDAGREEDHR